MPPLLSPLPGHALDLNPRVVERSVLSMLPIRAGTELPLQAAMTLPSWPDSKASLATATHTEMPSHTSILPSESISSVGIYPLPQDLVENHEVHQLPKLNAAVTAMAVPEFIPVEPPQSTFTDADLFEALKPLAGEVMRDAFHAENGRLDAYLDPLMRSTLRSALAGHATAPRLSKSPKMSRRLLWRIQALITRRDYHDILFERTRRYQVEEVLLLNADNLSLISFASMDPARHRSEKTVAMTGEKIARQLRAADGKVHHSFLMDDQLTAISCASSKLVLTALVRGEPNELMKADLEFAMNRIEWRFRDQLDQVGFPLLHAVQPFLEECLLIQAPVGVA
jgi:hypothetical protein